MNPQDEEALGSDLAGWLSAYAHFRATGLDVNGVLHTRHTSAWEHADHWYLRRLGEAAWKKFGALAK